MKSDSTWLDSVSMNDAKLAITSDLCSDEIYYLDLKTHKELFTENVTNFTSRTK